MFTTCAYTLDFYFFFLLIVPLFIIYFELLFYLFICHPKFGSNEILINKIWWMLNYIFFILQESNGRDGNLIGKCTTTNSKSNSWPSPHVVILPILPMIYHKLHMMNTMITLTWRQRIQQMKEEVNWKVRYGSIFKNSINGEDKAQCKYYKKLLGGKPKNWIKHLWQHKDGSMHYKLWLKGKWKNFLTPKVSQGKQELSMGIYDLENAKRLLALAIISMSIPYQLWIILL